MPHFRIAMGLGVMPLFLALGSCQKDDAKQAPAAASSQGALPQPSARVLSDAGVTSAVRSSLEHDPGIDAKNIRVRSTLGIVELTGSADNLLTKRRAVRVAEAVKGVDAVSDRIELKITSRPDAQLGDDLKQAFLADAMLQQREIRAAVDAGEVKLSGKVASWQERQMATRVAEGVRGVQAVKNEIQVEHGVARADPAIAADVRNALRWDTLVSDGLIDVQVHGGQVNLTGQVASAAEKRRAGIDAWVLGASLVNDKGLKVTWRADQHDLLKTKLLGHSDAEVEQAIAAAVSYDPRVSAADLQAVVRSGVATLKGSVGSVSAKLAAEDLARHTLGVVSVNNELSVKPRRNVSDAVLKRSVQSALSRDPYTNGYAIRATVKAGRVTLSGSVDDAFERAQATSVVAGILGVMDVDDAIQIKRPEIVYVYSPYLLPYTPYWNTWLYVPTKTSRSDAEIARDIHRELQWSPFVDADDVKVSVSDGKATLTGEVNSRLERTAAVEDAYRGGATAVDNLLAVSKGG
jgi:osmotically-inducible protein OsmY